MTKLTGNYRVAKLVQGAKPLEIASGSKERMKLKLEELKNEFGEYILQEEAYTTDSLKDDNNNKVNSIPYWRNSN